MVEEGRDPMMLLRAIVRDVTRPSASMTLMIVMLRMDVLDRGRRGVRNIAKAAAAGGMSAR